MGLNLSILKLIMLPSRQMNMDYAICHALNYHSDGLPEACIMYDIGCQWCRWFMWRVLQSPHLDIPSKMKVFYAVGKFHLGGHDVKCFPKFTLNFMSGAGQAAGEILETLWLPLKLIVRSSRSMSIAHRMEFLDHQMRDSNFLKMVHMGGYSLSIAFAVANISIQVSSLLRRRKTVSENIGPARAEYCFLTASLSEDDASGPTKWGIQGWISTEASLRERREHTLAEWATFDQKTMMSRIEGFEYFQVKSETGKYHPMSNLIRIG